MLESVQGHQAVVYGALMQCAAAALQALAADPSPATPTTTPGAPAPIVCPLCHASTLTLIALWWSAEHEHLDCGPYRVSGAIRPEIR